MSLSSADQQQTPPLLHNLSLTQTPTLSYPTVRYPVLLALPMTILLLLVGLVGLDT